MNKIERGKRQLSGFGIALIVLSVAFFVLGLAGIIIGASLKGGLIVLIVLGLLFILLSLACVVYGIVFVWLKSALVATKGNLKEDNSIAKTTLGVKKCNKCGTELKAEETACSNCGKVYIAEEK